jgi:uncharacterized membrane protein
MPNNREAGSVSVEFAIVAPLAVAVLALVLCAGSVASLTVRAQYLADASARALSHGDSVDSVHARLNPEGLDLSAVEREPGLLCAQLKNATPHVTGSVRGVFSLIPLAVSARACAAIEPS